MNKKIIKTVLGLICGYSLIFPKSAQAVIPPDFIFNIGTQIAQFFSIIVLFFSAIFGAFFQFFRNRFITLKYKKSVLAVTIFLIIGISLTASYFYANYKQKVEYAKWLEESKKNSLSQNSSLKANADNLINSTELDYQNDPNNPNNQTPTTDENNQLNIGKNDNENIDLSVNKFVSKIEETSAAAKFISEYYRNIATGNYEQAYAVSKKVSSLAVFKGWYLMTTKITLDKLVQIDEQKASVELTIFEGEKFTRYGVLMTLGMQGNIPIKVEKSEVKILAQGAIESGNVSMDEKVISQEYAFFQNNENRNIIITNQEFKNATDNADNNYIVLDARENIEYENGYFPGSVHIRFADLKAGRWIEVPKDKFVFVICWSGIRGKEVAEFLRTKKIVSSYLENGANGWVDFGGKWVGDIKFVKKYNDAKYQIVFNTEDVKKKVKEGAILVDTREPDRFKQGHIAGSVNIPIMYTPTINLESVFSQVPPNSRVITVCDGYVNCFDAKITGVELERRGHTFLGRYNKPWEYEK